MGTKHGSSAATFRKRLESMQMEKVLDILLLSVGTWLLVLNLNSLVSFSSLICVPVSITHLLAHWYCSFFICLDSSLYFGINLLNHYPSCDLILKFEQHLVIVGFKLLFLIIVFMLKIFCCMVCKVYDTLYATI